MQFAIIGSGPSKSAYKDTGMYTIGINGNALTYDTDMCLFNDVPWFHHHAKELESFYKKKRIVLSRKNITLPFWVNQMYMTNNLAESSNTTLYAIKWSGVSALDIVSKVCRYAGKECNVYLYGIDTPDIMYSRITDVNVYSSSTTFPFNPIVEPSIPYTKRLEKNAVQDYLEAFAYRKPNYAN